MSGIKQVDYRIKYTVDRIDGGIDKSNSPSLIGLSESPDCLNVTFDERGAVQTREGTTYFNTSTAEIGTNVICGMHEFNNSMVVWAGGSMFRVSGTTLVTIPSAQGLFASGVMVAYETFQNQVFCSDGTNGPYRYTSDSNFYKAGISVPSAPTARSLNAGDIAAGTYYYACTYVNTALFESEIGSASVAAVLTGSACVTVTSIPTASAILGVYARYIYRSVSSTGPWYFVKELLDNTTSSFTDTVAVGAEGGEPPDDATAPTPFTTVKLHKERLWFDDSSNRTLLRYTEFSNPYVSKALNFTPLSQGDWSYITAIGVQQDLVTVMKGESIWLVLMNDPTDDTTFSYLKSPVNVGIAGPRAFVEADNAIIFLAKRNQKLVGFQYLAGSDVLETQANLLKTRSISERIDPEMYDWPTALHDDVNMHIYDNVIYIGTPTDSTSTAIDSMYIFDLSRLGDEGQPGSWTPWIGVVGVTDFAVHNGYLYGALAGEGGHIIKFNNGTYTDADGSAINSYWWSKYLGGEPSVESWIKDFRFITPWIRQPGAYYMNMAIRVEGDEGTGTTYPIQMTGGGFLWDAALFGSALWGPAATNKELDVPLSSGTRGRRIQVGFNNQNKAGQGFKVFSFRVLMNLRKQR